MKTPFIPIIFVCATLRGAALPGDWPQFLGPQRDGTYTGRPIAKEWPKDGPVVLWRRDVGQGWSGPVVSGDRLILFHRLGDKAVVECLVARTGKPVWKKEYSTDYQDDFGFDEGPRATPAVSDGRVFTHGAEGVLSCWNLGTGDLLWRVDTVKEFQSPKGFFGRACSPLVESNLVFLNIGGAAGAGIVAFDAPTGNVRWKADEDEASYSSPTMMTYRGRRILLALTLEALVAAQPADGRVLFRFPWRPAEHASVSAAVPLVVDDTIFLSACYGADATLLRFQEGRPETLWSRQDALSNHYATSVHQGGFLFGWHGRQEQGCELRCVELGTGKVRWSEPGLKAGTLTLAGDELLVLTEQGELLRAPASPDGFKPTARVQILPLEVRASPAMVDGLFFARSKNRFVCLDLSRER